MSTYVFEVKLFGKLRLRVAEDAETEEQARSLARKHCIKGEVVGQLIEIDGIKQ